MPGSNLIVTGALTFVNRTPFCCPCMCPFCILFKMGEVLENKGCRATLRSFLPGPRSKAFPWGGTLPKRDDIAGIVGCWGGQKWRLLCRHP